MDWRVTISNLAGKRPRGHLPVAILRQPPGSWDELHGSLRGPMHERDWTKACLEAFQLEPYIVAVGPPERPRAIAPLALVRKRPESIGVLQLTEPMDFLAADEAAAEELGEALARLRLPLFLPRVPAASPALRALRRALRQAIVIERPMGGCPMLALDKGWAEPDARLSSKYRTDFRRARRRAGRIEAEMLAPTEDETPALVEAALNIERRSWKGRNGTAVLQLPGQAAFFRRYCMMKAHDGSLRLAFLRVDGQDAAMQIAVERDNAYWLLKIGFNERYARCSPGQLLIGHSIGWAAARGLTSYEFLGKEEKWIRVWTKEERPCVGLAIYPLRAASALAALQDAREFLKWKLKKRRAAR